MDAPRNARAAGGEDRDDQQGCRGNRELHCSVSRNAVEHPLDKMDCSCRSRGADEDANDGKCNHCWPISRILPFPASNDASRPKHSLSRN